MTFEMYPSTDYPEYLCFGHKVFLDSHDFLALKAFGSNFRLHPGKGNKKMEAP
jgi:hypothetical protein